MAAETMRRVRRNCECLVFRLQFTGYVFGTFPDGSSDYYTKWPLITPPAETLAGLADLVAGLASF